MMNNIGILRKRSHILPNRECIRLFKKSIGDIHDLFWVGDTDIMH